MCVCITKVLCTLTFQSCCLVDFPEGDDIAFTPELHEQAPFFTFLVVLFP